MLYVGDVTALTCAAVGTHNLVISGSGGSIVVHAQQAGSGCREVLRVPVLSGERVHGIHALQQAGAASSVWMAVWGGSQVQVLQLVGDTSQQQLNMLVSVSCQLQCSQPLWVHDVCLVPWTPDRHQQPPQQHKGDRSGCAAGRGGWLVVAGCLHNSLHCWALMPPSVAASTQPPALPATSAAWESCTSDTDLQTGAWQGHYAGTWQCHKQQMLYSMSLGLAAGKGHPGQQQLWVAAGGILRDVCCWHLPLPELQAAATAAVQRHSAAQALCSSSTPGPAPTPSSAAEAAKGAPQGQPPSLPLQQPQQHVLLLRHVPEAAVLQGHEGSVHHVRWVLPGQLLVSTSDDRSARVWRLQDTGSSCQGQLAATCWGHAARVWDADLAGPLLVTAGEDGTCRLWDVADGSCAAVIQSPSRHCRFWRCKLAAHNGQLLLVSGAADASLRMWSLGHHLSGRLLKEALAAMSGGPGPQAAQGADANSSNGGTTCGSSSETAGASVDLSTASCHRAQAAGNTVQGAVGAGSDTCTSTKATHSQHQPPDRLVFTLCHQAAAVGAALSGLPSPVATAAGDGDAASTACEVPSVAGGVVATHNRCTHKSSSRSSASDSKSEWVRALALVSPQLLLVATNKGLLHAVTLPDPTSAAAAGCREVWTLLYEHPAGGPFTSLVLLGQPQHVSQASEGSSVQQSGGIWMEQQAGGVQSEAATTCCRVALGHIKGQACLFDLDLSIVPLPRAEQPPAGPHVHTAAAAAAAAGAAAAAATPGDAGGGDCGSGRLGGYLQQKLQAPLCAWAAHGGAPLHGVFSSRVLGGGAVFTTSSAPVLRWWAAPAASTLTHHTSSSSGSSSSSKEAAAACQPATAPAPAPHLLAEAASPYTARVTAVDLASSGKVLVMGDQAGNVLTYHVPADIWRRACGDHSNWHAPPTPQEQEQSVPRRLPLLQRFKGVHGGTPVRCILPTAAEGRAYGNTAGVSAADGFVTGGRDGCLARFAVYPVAAFAAAAHLPGEGAKAEVGVEHSSAAALSQDQLCAVPPAAEAGAAATGAAHRQHQEAQTAQAGPTVTSSSHSSSVVLSGVERLVGMTSIEEELQVPAALLQLTHGGSTSSTSSCLAAAAPANQGKQQAGRAPTTQPEAQAGANMACVARCGFKASCFVAWDVANNQPLLSIECGGARRPFSICCGPHWSPAAGGTAHRQPKPAVQAADCLKEATNSNVSTHGATCSDVEAQAAAAAHPAQAALSTTVSSGDSTDRLQVKGPPHCPPRMVSAAAAAASSSGDQLLTFAWCQDQDIHVVCQQLMAGSARHLHGNVMGDSHQLPAPATHAAVPAAAGGSAAPCDTLQQAYHAKEVNSVVVLACPAAGVGATAAAAGTAGAGAAAAADQHHAVITCSEDGTVRCLVVSSSNSSGSGSSRGSSLSAEAAGNPALCGAAPRSTHGRPCLSPVNDNDTRQNHMPGMTTAAHEAGASVQVGLVTDQQQQQVQLLASTLMADHASGASIKCLDGHAWPHSSSSSSDGGSSSSSSSSGGGGGGAGAWLVVAGGSKELLMVWRVGWAPKGSQRAMPCTSSSGGFGCGGRDNAATIGSSSSSSSSSSRTVAQGPQQPAWEFQQQLLSTWSGDKGLRPKAMAAGDVLLQADVRHLSVKVVRMAQLPPGGGGGSPESLHPSVQPAAAGLGTMDGSGSGGGTEVHLVVSRSDARLLLMRLVLPLGVWQRVAVLQHHTHPVLSLAASWVTLTSGCFQEDPRLQLNEARAAPKQVLLLASGCTQGEVAAWELSHIVNGDTSSSSSVSSGCAGNATSSSSGGGSGNALVVTPMLVLPSMHQSGINSMCFAAAPRALGLHTKPQLQQRHMGDAPLVLVTGGDDQAVAATELHVVGVQPHAGLGSSGRASAAAAGGAVVITIAAGGRCCVPGAHASAVRGVSAVAAIPGTFLTVGWDQWLNTWQLQRPPAASPSQHSSSSSGCGRSADMECTKSSGRMGAVPAGAVVGLQLVKIGRRRVLATEPGALSSTGPHDGMALQPPADMGSRAATRPQTLVAVVGGGVDMLMISGSNQE